MPILAFLSNLGMGGGGSVQQRAGGSYKNKRRVLIGKEVLYVTDQELSVILRQLMEEETKAGVTAERKGTNQARVQASPSKVEFDSPAGVPFTKFEQLVRQQVRLQDFQTLALLNALRDEEDIEMLLLH